MAFSHVIQRLKSVLACVFTLAALGGVALGLVFSMGNGQFFPGLCGAAGCYIAWYFMDTALWDPRAFYLRVFLVTCGITLPFLAATLGAIVWGIRGWTDPLTVGALFFGIGTLITVILWIVQGFYTHNVPEGSEGHDR